MAQNIGSVKWFNKAKGSEFLGATTETMFLSPDLYTARRYKSLKWEIRSTSTLFWELKAHKQTR